MDSGKFYLQNTVKSFETDAFGRITIPNIFYYFQEAANHHATSLDWGMEYLDSIDKFWVLSRIKLQIDTYPLHKDNITVETWSRGASGFIACRDYQVLVNDQMAIRATSSWLILDKNSHRPCKIDSLGKVVPGIDLNAIPFPDYKIPNLSHPELLMEKKIHFSDIDINKHVNNGKYAEMYVDALSENILNTGIIREMDILYMQETQFNDCIAVFKDKINSDNNSLVLNMVRASDQKEVSRCIIKVI